jgi:uncharacterized protein YggE
MSSPTPTPSVTVRGEARLSVEPEVADVHVTVLGRGRDRQTALERCTARQAEVSGVVSGAGDAVELVETTSVAVHPEHVEAGPPTSVATVQTRLTVVRLDAVADLLMALGELDDVDVFGPAWRLRPQSPAYEEARLAAVQDAMHRARQYARAFGAQLTAVLAVSESGLLGGGTRSAVPMAAAARFDMAEAAFDRSFDLAPARQEVHGTVEVRFAMSEPDQEVFRG